MIISKKIDRLRLKNNIILIQFSVLNVFISIYILGMRSDPPNSVKMISQSRKNLRDPTSLLCIHDTELPPGAEGVPTCTHDPGSIPDAEGVPSHGIKQSPWSFHVTLVRK